MGKVASHMVMGKVTSHMILGKVANHTSTVQHAMDQSNYCFGTHRIPMVM